MLCCVFGLKLRHIFGVASLEKRVHELSKMCCISLTFRLFTTIVSWCGENSLRSPNFNESWWAREYLLSTQSGIFTHYFSEVPAIMQKGLCPDSFSVEHESTGITG